MVSLEYIAGFFDGEGCINVSYCPPHHFQVQLSIGNTDKNVLVEIQKVLGGKLRCCKTQTSTRKDVWVLHWGAFAETQKVLRILCPHLLVKREKAMLTLALLDSHKPKIVTEEERILLKVLLPKT